MMMAVQQWLPDGLDQKVKVEPLPEVKDLINCGAASVTASYNIPFHSLVWPVALVWCGSNGVVGEFGISGASSPPAGALHLPLTQGHLQQQCNTHTACFICTHESVGNNILLRDAGACVGRLAVSLLWMTMRVPRRDWPRTIFSTYCEKS